MSKAAAKREQILDRLADFLLAEGLGAASLRPLAAAAGTSDRMLLYYFKDKDEILAGALERTAARLTAALEMSEITPRSPAQLEAEMLALVGSPVLWPYMCVWLEVAALAARGDPLCRAVGHRVALGFQAWIAARLAIDGPVARDAAALGLLRTVEGAIFLRSVGLG